MKIEWTLHHLGWADVSIQCGSKRRKMLASYLRDSLRELATAALAISRGDSEARVTLEKEPGEHQIVMLRKGDARVKVEVREWQLGLDEGLLAKGGVLRFDCEMTVPSLREAVVQTLENVLAEYGEEGYRRKWGEHGFPTDVLAQLRAP